MRERRGWTRIELAMRAGLGRMVESRIRAGNRKPRPRCAAADRPCPRSTAYRVVWRKGPLGGDGGRRPSRDPGTRPAARAPGGLHGDVRTADTPGGAVALRGCGPRFRDVTSVDPGRMLEHHRGCRIGRTIQRPKGRGARGSRDRAVGQRQLDRTCLGRARDGEESCTGREISGGIWQPISWVVARVGRCTHDRIGPAVRARPCVVRCRRHAIVRMAPTLRKGSGAARQSIGTAL